MPSFSNTELNAVVQELWDQEVDDARYATAVLVNRVLNKTAIAKKKGDIVHLTVDGTLTAGDVGANGAFIPQVYTPTSVALTVDQHVQVAIELEDRTESQVFWNPMGRFPREAGKAMGVDHDDAIAALHGNLTSNIVGTEGSPGAFTAGLMRASMLKLDDRNVPASDRSYILPPVAYYDGILAETQLTDADKAGLPKSLLTTGLKTQLIGVPYFSSTRLVKVGTAYKGFLLHKSTFAIAFQRENEFKRADRTAALVLSEVQVVQALYGVITFRENHGVLIHVLDSNT